MTEPITLAKTSAISLAKVTTTAPDLIDPYNAAGIILRKTGTLGSRAAVYLALDHSYSMHPFYADQTVQHLADRVLSLAAHLDDDGIVPTVFFSDYLHQHRVGTGQRARMENTADIVLGDHQGRVDALHRSIGDMGGTKYGPAMRAIMDHYSKSGSTDPAYVAFQTDGEPSDGHDVTELLKEAASLPIFWQFIGFGEGDFAFLRSLDTMPPTARVVDNAGFFAAGTDPATLPDEQLYDLLVSEYATWLVAARAAGIMGPGAPTSRVRINLGTEPVEQPRGLLSRVRINLGGRRK